MKKLIANCLIAFTLLSTSAFYAVAQKPDRGSGPNSSVTRSIGRYLISGTFRVQAQHITWHRVFMTAGTNVDLSLSGDGTTDLDMYVYDGSGEIASSTRNGDDEAADIEIYRSGYFWVKVVNYGDVYNDYRLSAIEF
jgi:hypothetical protein